MFKVGDKGKTKDGAAYEIIHVLPLEAAKVHSGMSLMVMIEGNSQARWRYPDGRYSKTDEHLTLDLLPPTRTVYVNTYLLPPGGTNTASFATEEEARHHVGMMTCRGAAVLEVAHEIIYTLPETK